MSPIDLLAYLPLYLVTDDQMPWQQCFSITKQVVNARAGVTAVQLRDKISPKSVVKEHAKELQMFLRPLGVPLIINDHVDLVCEVDAAGVHLGQGDCPVTFARRILGTDAIIGLSLDRLEDFDPDGCWPCDYVAASPVFATTTKKDTAQPWGLAKLRRLRELSSIPVIAIGGIHEGNLSMVAETGVDGIAVVSAIYAHSKPQEMASHLRSQFQLCKK